MKIKHKNILKMPVAITSCKEVIDWITESGNDKSGKYICVSNVHMCMEAYDNENFEQVVNNANFVVPDGKPLVWGLNLLGENKAQQVRGSDLMLSLCKEAEKKKIPIGLYGGTVDSLEDLLKFLQREFPRLKIPFLISPPFRPLTLEEDCNYVKQINESGIKILFVGIGCPKQENWMAEHREKLSCVMLGVGAAFDFFSGRKKHAPRWMQKAGLEWVFRLAIDPKRLWKRYLKHNPRFIWHFGKQVVAYKLQRNKRI